MTRELLQQALDALESCEPADTSTGHVCWPSFDEDAVDKAIDALGAALAAPQPEPVAWLVMDESGYVQHAASWRDAAHEHINDAINEHDLVCARTWRVVPVYTAPPAAPSANPAPGYCKHCKQYTIEDPLPASQWIACSERMPDADIDVLAVVDEATYIANYEPDGWYDARTFAPLDGITHWMDMPAAPSDEEA